MAKLKLSFIIALCILITTYGFKFSSGKKVSLSKLHALESLPTSFDDVLKSGVSKLPPLPNEIVNLQNTISQTWPQIEKSIEELIENIRNLKLPTDISEVEKSLNQLITAVSSIQLPTDLNTLKNQINIDELTSQLGHVLELLAADYRTIPAATVIVFIMVVFGFGQDDDNIGSPFEAGTSTYSVAKSDAFYGSRPFYVFRRLLKLAQITGNFNIKLLLDWRLGNLEKNEEERAKEALVLATQLGPTFIKLGQALSIRTDLIPKAYALELRQLQDAVPPFDTTIAKDIICKELGIQNLNEVFAKISEKPVASASIGQVYRSTLLDGRDVAVKVQRPNILSAIALDLYLLRLLTPFQVKISNAVNKRSTNQADIDVALALVDEWGRGFVAEVDYQLEAKNTIQFQQAMISRQLDSVTAPTIIEKLTKNRVIVTEWMEGTRLDIDASPDVPRLCGVAINAYLTMLLDTGVLHCDPHPGNLLRTKDGKLCILDWGMTLNVPKDLQYSLLEFIAHVNTEDYEQLPQDFINLGFSPSNKMDQLKRSGLTEGLSFAFRQLGKGGGPSKIRDRVKEEFKARYGNDLSDEELRKRARDEMINRMQQQLKDEGVDVNGVTEVMEEMSKRNRELFKLPPYVLYVSRAFSTLEGIGLSVNPEYSILQECYPYLAKRLLTDNSPRAKNALRSMLYGTSNMLSPSKLVDMTDNFSTYTTATATLANMNQGDSIAQKELAKLLLNPDGNAFQEILIEGTTKTADAMIRDTIHQLENSLPGKALRTLVKTPRDIVHNILPPNLRTLATPLTLPYDILHAISELTKVDEEDKVALSRVSSIQKLGGQKGDENAPTAKSMMSNNDDDDITTNTAEVNSLALSRIPIQIVTEQVRNPDSTLRKIVNDPEIRDLIPKSTSSITRRLAAAVFTRAAERVERSMSTVMNTSNSDDSSTSSTKTTNNTNDINKTVLKNIGEVTSSTARRLAEALSTSSDAN